jgi:hypothetical protein
MTKKNIKLIFGIYLAIAVAVCGYYYINPTKIYAQDQNWINNFGHDRLLEIDDTEFQYSILISIVVGIIIFTLLNFTKKIDSN